MEFYNKLIYKEDFLKVIHIVLIVLMLIKEL